MIYAPVMIPTLCRYEHFKECLESLSLCKGADMTEVFVGLDYPAKENHRPGYEKIKSYLEQVGNMNFKKIHVYLREVNYGGGKIVGNYRMLLQNVLILIFILRTTMSFLLIFGVYECLFGKI